MKIGILGMGNAGTRHALNAQALGHDVVCYDINQSKPDLKGIRMQPTRGDLFVNSDAVVIATPTEYHLEHLRVCLAQNKHVLVEKPLALNRQTDEVKNLLDMNAKTEHPSIIAVGYNLRFHPAIEDMKNRIKWGEDEGDYVHYASFTCCQHTDSEDALVNGCLDTWATHEIDLANYLLPPLRLIDHRADRFSVDLALWRWGFKGNRCHVTIHSDMIARKPVRKAVVCCQNMSYEIDLEADPVTNEHYLLELSHFIAQCEGHPSPALATGDDGLAALEIARRAAV
jgi:predicted dehydrogenase